MTGKHDSKEVAWIKKKRQEYISRENKELRG